VILFVQNKKDCYFSRSTEGIGKWFEIQARCDLGVTGLPSQAANPKESAVYPELNFRAI
jgi:hypothetical protein